MKKILFSATLLISIFCFSSCSKDDEAIEVNQLEEVWGMTAVNGYYYYEGEKIPYNENFNPFEPTDDCEKITIEKIEGNKYTVTHYEYYSGTWRRYDSENFYLEGNNMIPESMEGVDVSTAKILEASSDRLVIETTGADEYGSFYDKYTYTRMAE